MGDEPSKHIERLQLTSADLHGIDNESGPFALRLIEQRGIPSDVTHQRLIAAAKRAIMKCSSRITNPLGCTPTAGFLNPTVEPETKPKRE